MTENEPLDNKNLSVAQLTYNLLRRDPSSYAYDHSFDEWRRWWDEEVVKKLEKNPNEP
jgi:hypothetical protein